MKEISNREMNVQFHGVVPTCKASAPRAFDSYRWEYIAHVGHSRAWFLVRNIYMEVDIFKMCKLPHDI